MTTTIGYQPGAGVQPPRTTPDPYRQPITTPGGAAHGTQTGECGDARARELSSDEQTAARVIGALVAALGLLGFANSFARVSDAARPSFHAFAPTVPIGIDVGIAVFAALDILLARLTMRLRWLRLIPWSLTAATVYLNVSGEHDAFGIVAHATLPALWVTAVEVAAHVVRVRAGVAAGTRMDDIRASRWLLDPLRTALLWRHMVLWEVRSYPLALQRERDRLLALTELKDTYGPIAWRWKAPRRVKALYRLGELIPATVTPEIPEPPTDRPRTKAKTVRQPNLRPVAGRSRARSASKRRTSTRTVPDVDDLMPLGRRVAAEVAARGEPLKRDALAAGLRAAGQSAGNARVGALLARLKAPPAEALIEGDLS